MYEITMHLLMSAGTWCNENEARMEEKLMLDLPVTQSSGIVSYKHSHYT